MPPQIKSMNELVEYLSELDERVTRLEQARREWRMPAVGTGKPDEQSLARCVARSLPMTNLVHPNFLKRAFAVWGHFFVANLIISIPLNILYLCRLWMAFSRLSQNP